ncbi:family 43 glycosylhydrolase [Luteolibacter soli]|uniref:Family 43 glycosylhydrolase n=1 Tax=Luteolibacter soli TaxID=3135280 RepID=A0ABU9AXY9_9BACT
MSEIPDAMEPNVAARPFAMIVAAVFAVLSTSLAGGAQEVEANAKHGLRADFYSSSESKPFDRLRKITTHSGIAFADLVPELRQVVGTSDSTAIRWVGQIAAPGSADYTFHLTGDNGFRLWIDGRLIIDHWLPDWDKEQSSAPVHLDAGSKHEIKVEYFNVGGGASLRLSWSTPDTPKETVPAVCFYLPERFYTVADLRFYVDDVVALQRNATVGKAIGSYPQAAMDALTLAIDKAKALQSDERVASAGIGEQIDALKTARDAFKRSVVKEPYDGVGTGNPVLPGYWADPTVYYDAPSNAFYCFATVDGVDAGWQHDPHYAVSKDLVNWKIVPIDLPKVWPLPVAGKPRALWAPSIVRSTKNDRYYLTYFIEGSTYIASADSPMGPWKNATTGTTAETCRLSDGFDAQLFIDSDGEMYLSHAASEFKLSHLNVAADGMVSVDNGHPQATEGDAYKFKTIHRIRVFGEGTALLKHGEKYYLFYAEFGSQNYCVKYATAPSVWGPYTEQPGFVMERDAVRDILGPGHVSLFEYGGDTYIGYHRQHFPFVDSKRQTCVNRITFTGDSVGLDVQNHSGMRAGNGALEQLVAKALGEREANLALGKVAIASSVSDYKGGEFADEPFAPIPGFYKAGFAVDDNWGTRWMAGTDQATPSSLIVDLGADTEIGRTETVFEHVRKVYRYKIESLSQADAADVNAASKSDRWAIYADRSNNAQKQSPVVDSKRVSARYLRITILSADLPTARESTSPGRTDYLDRVSVVEFGVFAKP